MPKVTTVDDDEYQPMHSFTFTLLCITVGLIIFSFLLAAYVVRGILNGGTVKTREKDQ